ncbi:MAG: nucleoside deaminase [Desulfobacteraceae bacterium]|nr:nucleoside deaminase [Desulfobacteraceae bacterium]
MTNEQIRETGLQQLDKIVFKSENTGMRKTGLTDYQFNNKYPDDAYIWLTCVLALTAVHYGNFGIGCVLVSADDNVFIQGHNEVFNPYFRSDRHAEMVVMNKFEQMYKKIAGLKNCTLYSSVESCPMCLTRLITSGISRVLHAAPDKNSGMVHKMKELPAVWLELSKEQYFGQAHCSQYLIDTAKKIFLLNVGELDERLKKRASFFLTF